MPYVDVFVEPSDVLEDLTDEEVKAELIRRESKNAPAGSRETYDSELLEQVWLHFRGKEAPTCLREYMWRVLGKCL